MLAKSHLMKEVRGAALGPLWIVVRPMMLLFVYWFVLSVGLRAGRTVDTDSFLLWLLAGLLPWFFISGALGEGPSAFRKYSYLITKVKFPVSTIPTLVMASNLITHFWLTVGAIVIVSFTSAGPSIYYLQLPLYMLAMFLFFTVFSLWAGTVGAISKDFINFMKSISRMFFWTSGVIYSIAAIPNEKLREILLLNPITVFIEGYRNSLVFEQWFWEDPRHLLVLLFWFTLLIIMGLRLYKKHREEMVDDL